MEDAEADVKEYVTMLAAGLVGGSPHMISASVGALARVVFEFQGVLS
jgi:ribosomal RNA-processing protein 12